MSACDSKRGEYEIRKTKGGVVPGMCNPLYGCPPPTEVVCILTEKVYDECKKILVSEEKFIFEADPDNPVKDVTCLGAELLDGPHCEVIRPGRISIRFSYRVSIRITLDDNQEFNAYRDFNFSKSFSVPRAGEQNLLLQCSVPIIECLSCFVQKEKPDYDFLETTIICCVGMYLLVKLKAKVQLLIPSYGFCPEPPDCDDVLGECPAFQPVWPPYPPQTR